MPSLHPLSYGQRSLWFLHQFSPEGGAYNVTIPLKFLGPLDVEKVRRCFQILFERHPILRATYKFDGNQAGYQIHPAAPIPFEHVDGRSLGESEIVTYLNRATHQLFQLDVFPILRLLILSASDEIHYLTLTTHHINADLFSLANLLDEFFHLFSSPSPDLNSLPPVEASFEDYVLWQQSLLQGPEGQRLLSYWTQKLAAPLPRLTLPIDKPRPPLFVHHGEVLSFRIERESSDQLRTIARSENSTLFMILLAAYYALLFQQSGQEDLIVGTPVPGRRGNPRFERVLGTFINVLALRATLSRGLSFRDLLQNISTVVREARDHQEFPFPLLVEKLRLPRDSSRTPIFQGYFTLQRLAVHQERLAFFLPFHHDPPLKIQAGGMTWGTVPVAQQEGQMELAVHVYDVNGELFPEFKYNTALFHRETVEGMARSYLVILQRMLRDLDWSLADLATMKQ
jgi:hypothetical protein